jgi:hypothetical protein
MTPRKKGAKCTNHEWVPGGYGTWKCVWCPMKVSTAQRDTWARMRAVGRVVAAIRNREKE